MSTHPATSNSTVTRDTPASATTTAQRESMVWLLRQFASETQGVTHAVLLSRDGLRLLDSDVDKDWADELSAAFSGIASLAANVSGPTHRKRPAGQVVIERDDCLFFVQSAGRSAAFDNHPGDERGEVDTILAVITARDADAGTVGFEMARLVAKFAPYMLIPVRVGTGGEVR
ncbi:roadblock/LC7 domain-containing protein [Streptomyces sp. STCH 565 A]|uniref:roadblock/LC7 domain-containing protein n=1 Tax=Streptomyces sp. STCH 565 A TaxID=2950532 RepID=UPI002074D448|nr:roadblock/LC7 domain-containing protein [Streptomyces sp. STCH 565 A]MCM8555435.1 roadblock/LC7 domain-containing protein [Streptomyces sp. STCH 565 A]